MLYTAGIAAVKFSVLLLYHRIFPNPRFRILLWSVGGFILCYTVVQELMAMFQCRPISGAWDPNVYLKAECIKLNLEWVIMASFNVLTDVITLCLPLPLVWRLHIDKGRKYQLISVFLLGSLQV